MTQVQVCKDLGISKAALGRWVQDDAFKAAGMTPTENAAERKEMAASLRRIRELEMENEVLRRAAAYLSQANLKSPK
jgi:transposase